MSERGLGTPATRAATIEGLIRQKYITRDGRELIATGKGVRLIDLLQEMDVKPLTSPEMTGDWEAKLHQMEKGELARDTFMNEIKKFTESVVQKARGHYEQVISKPFPDLKCPCPNCNAPELKQTDATYECREPDCGFRISKYIAGRLLTEEEATTLFTTKFLEQRDGFVSRFNRPFEAALELTQQVSKTGKKGKWKTGFVFDSDLESVEDLTDDQLVKEVTLTNGKQAKLYETEKAFMVPAMVTKDNPDGFRLGKTILQKELTASDVEKMLTAGKTDLLPGFISKKTKRAFAAHLTLDPDTAKIGFEFAPRKAAKKAAKKKD
ncbi:MAG: topoisomerase C-terminal repeat-containing protein, partial [Akkermansiaceae bacterium]